VRSYGCGWYENLSVYIKVSDVKDWILAICGIKDIPKGTIKAVAIH
jgi:hypothetical protein